MRLLASLLTTLLLAAGCGPASNPVDTSTDEASDTPVEIPEGPCLEDERLVVTEVTVHELYVVTLESEPYVIVDVREVGEMTDIGIIEGSLVMPYMSGALAEQHGTLPDDGSIYIICDTGTRSALAAQFLVDQGHLCVNDVPGALEAWIAADYPLVTP